MSNETSPVLEVEHLGISFGGLKAVGDFNLEIAPGELVGLIGPNGAGKTTVFNLLTGVYKPTEGEIRLCGRRINGMGDNVTVAVHVNRLREKIEADPSNPQHIQTVWGAGYRFKP